jgi:hypothetical protein
MKIIHNGKLHSYEHHSRNGRHVHYWRPVPIGAGSTNPSDPNVIGAPPAQGFAPFVNPETAETLGKGKQS